MQLTPCCATTFTKTFARGLYCLIRLLRSGVCSTWRLHQQLRGFPFPIRPYRVWLAILHIFSETHDRTLLRPTMVMMMAMDILEHFSPTWSDSSGRMESRKIAVYDDDG